MLSIAIFLFATEADVFDVQVEGAQTLKSAKRIWTDSIEFTELALDSNQEIVVQDDLVSTLLLGDISDYDVYILTRPVNIEYAEELESE